MTVRISADIHFGPADIRHRYHPGDDKCHAYGALKIDSGDTTGANLYFDNAAHIDAVIAELVALRNEMEPYAAPCLPSPWVMSEDGTTWRALLPDGRTAKIERLEDGDEDGNGAVFLPTVHESAQDFETGPECDGLLAAANWVTGQCAAPEREPLCDSELPLTYGGVLKCTLDEGHYGAHSALAGAHRWLGHGMDARNEQGDKIAPLSVAAVPERETAGSAL